MASQHELQPLNQQQLPYPQQQFYPPQSTSTFQPHSQQQVHFAPPQPPQQQQQVYFAPSPPPQSPYIPSTTTQNMNNYDPEGGASFEFDDQSIRKGFIRKVFSILSVQLTFTTGVISLFVFYPPAAEWVMANIWIYWASLIALFVVLIMIACCENMRRKSPMNYVLLGILTACMSLMLGFTCAFFDSWEVMLAVGITVVVTISLVIFAFQTRWDFTTMGGVLFVAVIVLIFLAIFSLIFPNRVFTIVYASIGALIFCIYLVYDIQLMMGGKHKYSISPEEYIFASLNLYIDIVNIFMYILMIISASRN